MSCIVIATQVCAVNLFSKQSVVMLALSFGKNMIPKRLRNTVVPGTPLFVRDFAVGHITWELWLRSLPTLFPTFEALFSEPFSWYFVWPSLLPFCLLHPWFLVITFCPYFLLQWTI
jgi:hypothetical protein